IELLDAVVVPIRNVDASAPVGRQTERLPEQAVARAGAPPRAEEGAARVELLDAVIKSICDVDVSARVGRHTKGAVELSVPSNEEGAGRVKLLDAVIVRIRNVDVPAPIGRHAVREVELHGARFGAPPRGEEGAATVELL